MTNSKEIRILAANVELREQETGAKELAGYAIKWEQLSEELGYFYKFREKFAKGAFSDSLISDDQKALWNHDSNIVLGRTKNKTLALEEDSVGLRFSIMLPETTWGNDTYQTVKRGDVDGVSFGFIPSVEEWDESDPENVIRTIKKAQLLEISPTPFPAYEGASSVSVRDKAADDAYTEHKKHQKHANKEQRKNDNELRRKIDA